VVPGVGEPAEEAVEVLGTELVIARVVEIAEPTRLDVRGTGTIVTLSQCSVR